MRRALTPRQTPRQTKGSDPWADPFGTEILNFLTRIFGIFNICFAMKPLIRIFGARQHNLKGFDLDLPLNRLIAVTGVSGSGKSSLAFETLYAEGQRRYVETFSPYMRQFLDRMDRPRVDEIQGIPPAIAIDQVNPVKTSRSTVGTMTEINDLLKLLYARLGRLFCRNCGREVFRESPEIVYERLKEHSDGRITIAVSYPVEEAYEKTAEYLIRNGFRRILIDGKPFLLEEDPTVIENRTAADVIIDRFEIKANKDRERIVESIEQAYYLGQGQAKVLTEDGGELSFSRKFHCAECNIDYPEPNPNLFSFNSPLGACPECEGFGKIIGISPELVVPNPELTIEEGAVKPWDVPVARYERQQLMQMCRKHGIPTDKPYRTLTDEQKRIIFEGDEEFYGIYDFFQWLEKKKYKMHVRVFLARYRSYSQCPSCRGRRLKPEALLFRINGYNIHDLALVSIDDLLHLFKDEIAEITKDEASQTIYKEIAGRLQYLTDAGVGYLTLDRQSRTLSGGEVERVNLTTALGSALVNTLFVLDEPSIGLHPRDTDRLIGILKNLRNRGNTVLVVEHDASVIKAADQIVDMGPESGERGGSVIFQGKFEELLKCRESLTGRYLSGDIPLPLPEKRRKTKPGNFIGIKGASQHNLKNIDVDIPLNCLVCITGVSGSGKSTLMNDVLYPAIRKAKGDPTLQAGKHDEITGADRIDNAVLIDQSPISKSSRTTPVTVSKAFDHIRKLYAGVPESIKRNYKPGHFSFNSRRAQCPTCKGEGYEILEMQFLADIRFRCPDCEGKRYIPEVLEVKYKGKSIAETLDMSVDEALKFFSEEKEIVNKLRPVVRLGLGYLTLGQPLNMLSGGESQRLKLIKFLGRSRKNRTLFLLDEPTTGLHFNDIDHLLKTLEHLIQKGNSVVVIEHNLQVIRWADHIIDLGPDGGDAGGYVTASGAPELIADRKNSHTGKYLKAFIRDSRNPFQTEEPFLPSSSFPVKSSSNGSIVVSGACENNLKNVSIEFPVNKMTTVTGISGSGKSTLVFDILFAEGQRRYIESLNAYARQFIKQLKKPDIDFISGIPPTVAIEQGLSRGGRRSTVATVSEVYDFLRLLFSKAGEQFCHQCGAPVMEQTPEKLGDLILKKFKKNDITIAAPVIVGRKGFHKEVFEYLKKKNHKKAFVNGELREITPTSRLDRYRLHDISAVIRRLKASPRNRTDIVDAIWAAVNLSGGEVQIHTPADSSFHLYSTRLFCRKCNIGFAELEPRTFSFNSKYGACPECSGTGCVSVISPDLLVKNEEETLEGDALAINIKTWFSRRPLKYIRALMKQEHALDLNKPLKAFSQEERDILFYGRNDGFSGLVNILKEEIARFRYPKYARFLKRFLLEKQCPACEGLRLKPSSLAVQILDMNIADILHKTVSEARQVLQKIKLTGRRGAAAEEIIPEMASRLMFMEEVGLGYLTLDRGIRTLSGGESQRIRLAAQLGSNLRGVCYILDEPTIGLHRKDNMRLINVLRLLQQKGNTVVVVEHDEETIRSSDHIIDLGPQGGAFGGELVSSGTVKEILNNKNSKTAICLRKQAERKTIPKRKTKRRNIPKIRIKRAGTRNLKNVSVSIPQGAVTCVCGVSGSGKSSLVQDTLYPLMVNHLRKMPIPEYTRGRLECDGHIKRVLFVDQSPIGRTPRSTPATYVGFFDDIRKLYASLPESVMRGYKPGRFSFNVKEGYCPKCKGQGRIKVEMKFLPDVYVPCEICRGRRYNMQTLDIRYRGKDISQILDMTMEEAAGFFSFAPSISKYLEILKEIGLGYLKLGQGSNTLSGGEAQRIKLCSELGKAGSMTTLYLLDEPTTGLHSSDIKKLTAVLRKLAQKGHTIVVIEHNLEFILESDYLIDIGPEGGEQGGKITARGYLDNLLKKNGPQSHTLHYLRKEVYG